MRSILYIMLVILPVLLPVGEARATDEINMGSPYQKFDPETGYYVTVNPQARAHTPQGNQAPATPASGSTSAGGNPAPAADAWPSGQRYALLAGSILLLVALGALFLRLR